MDKDRSRNPASTQLLQAAALTSTVDASPHASDTEGTGLAGPADASEHAYEDASRALAAYKQILRQALERRPAGIRRRLADVLGKNRSFISQLANPNYSTPIPAPYVEPIFAVCHFSQSEREAFLLAYEHAHPGRLARPSPAVPLRRVEFHLPDLGCEARNADLERLLQDLAFRLANLARPEPTSSNGAFP